MDSLKIGDYVARKSYGGDINFQISDISVTRNGRKVYLLKGMLYRIIADSEEFDLEPKRADDVQREIQSRMSQEGIHHMVRTMSPFQLIKPVRGTSGTILHLDSSSEFLEMCMNYYRDAKIKAYGHVIPESEQADSVKTLLGRTKADILVATGHDGLKKNAVKMNSVESYRNSRYFMQTALEARRYEPDLEKLCVFSGACQSYYEGIMQSGANFASSPGRILIHALDPAKVGDRIALTDSRVYVTPEKIAKLTQSGSKGIGGLNTRGHYVIK